VVVTSEGLQGDTVESVSFRFIDFFYSTSDFPDHEGSVSGSSDDDWRFFVFLKRVTSGDASNPVSVAFEVTD